MNDFDIREAEPNDIPFIYSTWLKSYRYDGIAGKGVKNSIFFPEYSKVIDRILAAPNTKVLVAHVKNERNVMLGYLVYEDNLFHYAFCKDNFQGFGITKTLAKEAFPISEDIICTAKTRRAQDIFFSKPQLIYNPFKLYKQ